jgi:two-component system chemotaxis response regulator CheB
VKTKHAQKTSRKVAKLSAGKAVHKDFPVIVLGASAGGFKALLDFMERLPQEINAAVFVVLHVSTRANISFLVQHLQHHTPYKCELASNKETIKEGRVYFAVPGMHLVVGKGKIIFGTGPEENRFKPSIDILFRTAAVEYRERVTGIILSGMLDDGVAGMSAIRRCGGLCIVQEPTEAEYPDMPLAVIEKMKPDHVLSAADIGRVILLETRKKRKPVKVPADLIEEVEIAEKVLSGIDETRKIGKPSLFTCPDCGGVLFHVDDPVLKRYRCFTGHAYSESSLLSKQSESIQATLWVALRQLEERKKILSKLPKLNLGSKKINELDIHIERLKKLLADVQAVSSESSMPVKFSA